MFEGEDLNVRQVGGRLLSTEGEGCTPAEQVDRIAGWEALIAHAQAQQLAEMTDLATRRRVGRWAQTPEDSRQRTYDSVNDEVAMARRISPVTAALHLTLAQILIDDLPHCFAALDAGRIGLHTARVIVAETDVLTSEQRAGIDEAVALEASQLTPGAVREAVRARVLAADRAAADKRATRVRADTYLGMVPRPDGVGMVYANLKAEDAVAVTESLDHHARALRAAGDERSLKQLRVDTFIDRLTTAATGVVSHSDQASNRASDTGTTDADGKATTNGDTTRGGEPSRRRINLNVVVSAATLLGLDDTPGMLTGYGHISPAVVRDILDGPDTWVRRLVADPIDGEVLTIDSRARYVTGLLRTFTDARDGICRRPYCANPITDRDHVDEHARGGSTNHRNTDGLCAPCHRTRHQAGWTLTPETGTARVWWKTPTGHTYCSDPPPAIGYGTLSHRLLRVIVQEGKHGPNGPRRRRRTAA